MKILADENVHSEIIQGGKVILLRYRIVNIERIVRDTAEVLEREAEALQEKGAMVIVLSEAGYRINRPGKATK